MRGLLFTITLVCTLVACDLYEPDVGPPLAGACDNEDSDPDETTSFSVHIRPLLVRMEGGCGCHLPSAGGIGIGTQLSGLDLGSMYTLRQGGTSSGSRIVVPNEPCASVLYQKISDTPPFGSRMPLGSQAYTDDELGLFHDWIAEGALDN